MPIAENLARINERIRQAAEKAGRDPASVRLVAVSKTRPAADIVAASKAGQTVFGENYIQELVPKLAEVRETVEWHVIGHLQSNKVKYLAGLVTLVHSVDRLSLAEEISRQWGRLGRCCDLVGNHFLLCVIPCNWHFSGFVPAHYSLLSALDSLTFAYLRLLLPQFARLGRASSPAFNSRSWCHFGDIP